MYNKLSLSLKKLKVDNPTFSFCLLALDIRILIQSINQYIPKDSMTACITKIVTMFVNVENTRSSGRVVPPLAAGRSPTKD